MRNPRILGLLLLLAVLLGIFVFSQARPNEPHYRGHSLTHWLTMADPPPPENAVRAVRTIGTNAIPALLRWINYEPAPWQKKLASIPIVSRNGWAPELLHEPAIANAMKGFALLGTNATPAIPPLVKLMKNKTRPEAAMNAIYALGRIGQSALPFLTQALSDTNQADHVQIIYSISYMRLYGVPTGQCLIAIMNATTDNDPRARLTATNEITRLTSELPADTTPH